MLSEWRLGNHVIDSAELTQLSGFCTVLLYSALLCSALLCCALLCSTALLYYTIPHAMSRLWVIIVVKASTYPHTHDTAGLSTMLLGCCTWRWVPMDRVLSPAPETRPCAFGMSSLAPSCPSGLVSAPPCCFLQEATSGSSFSFFHQQHIRCWRIAAVILGLGPWGWRALLWRKARLLVSELVGWCNRSSYSAYFFLSKQHLYIVSLCCRKQVDKMKERYGWE